MIPASMVPAILGLHKNVTPESALRQMIRTHHKAPEEWERTVIDEWDEYQRPHAIFEFAGVTGRAVHEAERFDSGIFSASPDGFIQNDAHEWGLIKIRTPFHRREASCADDFEGLDDQERLYAQMQIEMLCTGVTWAALYQWAPKSYRMEFVEFDPAWLDANMPELRRFYVREYMTAIEDPADHLAPKRKSFDNAKLRRLIAEIDDANQQIAQATEHREKLMADLAAQAKGDATIVCGRKLTKVTVPGEIDVMKIIKNHLPNRDLSSYRGPSKTYWELSQ